MSTETQIEQPSAVSLTESAARQVKEMLTNPENAGKNLRVYVEGGGCSGLQYGMVFDERRPDDATADYFGADHVGLIYGLMLTAWGVAGVLGPTLMATLRERSGRYDDGLRLIAGLMLVSAIIPLLVRPPALAGSERTRPTPGL